MIIRWILAYLWVGSHALLCGSIDGVIFVEDVKLLSENYGKEMSQSVGRNGSVARSG